MSFVFDNSYINKYCDDDKKVTFSFSQDLRQFFPKTNGRGKYGNNTIGDILKRRGVVVKSNSMDTEYSCVYIEFRTEGAAKAFLKRLNALREVKNYKEPEPTHYTMTTASWTTLKKFLRKTLTAKQYEDLQNLDLEFITTVVPQGGGYN
jgi:hypothetical protein